MSDEWEDTLAAETIIKNIPFKGKYSGSSMSLSPEVCVEDVSGPVTGGMSRVASDLVTENDNKHRYEKLVLFMSW